MILLYDICFYDFTFEGYENAFSYDFLNYMSFYFILFTYLPTYDINTRYKLLVYAITCIITLINNHKLTDTLRHIHA